MTPIQKLAKLALDNPELRPGLMPILRSASKKEIQQQREAARLTNRPHKLFDPNKVEQAAKQLRRGDPDWEYRVVHDPTGRGKSFIEIYDEDGKFVNRFASAMTQVTGPKTTEIYENEIDHGYDQPLSGGTDVMKRLQSQFLIEQGRAPRETNPEVPNPKAAGAFPYRLDGSHDPRLAMCQQLQSSLVRLLKGPEGQKQARFAVCKFAGDTDSTIVVTAAVEELLDMAVAVALDPVRMGRVIQKHTATED